MGWNSWIKFKCQTDCINYPDLCINENLYMQMADRMASDGYQLIQIADCWMDSGCANNLVSTIRHNLFCVLDMAGI